jgi:peptide/nickel transport system permease protein
MHKDLLQGLIKNRGILTGFIIVIIFASFAIFAHLIAPYDPLAFSMRERFQSPNKNHLFGTDNYGRDIFSRIVFGSRISLKVGLTVMLITTILGTVLGLIAGYFSSIDYILMRAMDAFMAFPVMLLGISIVAILGPSEMNVAIALSVAYTPRTARIVRGAVLELKNSIFVQAARAIGAGDLRILLLHILPNALAPMIVQATFIFAYAVIAEAGLSFVGAGPAPPTPSWGNILCEGREYIRSSPWITIFPGLFIVITVLGLNLAGDGLRDVLDPRLSKE